MSFMPKQYHQTQKLSGAPTLHQIGNFSSKFSDSDAMSACE